MTNAITRSATSRRSGAARDRVRSLGERRSASDRREIERAGYPVHAVRPPNVKLAGADYISFVDPSGNRWNRVARASRQPPLFPARDAGITGFSHIVCARPTRAVTKRFDARVQRAAQRLDRRGAALAHQRVHHTIALFPSTYAGVRTSNHQVETIDDVMRSWYLLREQRGIRIVFGRAVTPRRRGVSVFEALDGMIYEYSSGHDHRRRSLVRTAPVSVHGESFCMWDRNRHRRVPQIRPEALPTL